MSTPALFDPPPETGAEAQTCDFCAATVEASIDGLRVRGWQAYDGVSFTGKKLTVRICPDCRA